MDLYYGDDYSLGEIAEEFEVSRQAVYDNLRRTEKLLEAYEGKLHLLRDFELRSAAADELDKYVQTNYGADEYLMTLVEHFEKLE